MPPRVNGTVTVRPPAAERLTAKVMSAVVAGSSPSVTAAASATDTVGVASSSLIVPTAPASSSAPPALGALSATAKVSSNSSRVSSLLETVMVPAVAPASKLSVAAVVTDV